MKARNNKKTLVGHQRRLLFKAKFSLFGKRMPAAEGARLGSSFEAISLKGSSLRTLHQIANDSRRSDFHQGRG